MGLGGYETLVSGSDGWTGALIGVMVGQSCSWTGFAVRLEGSWIVVPVNERKAYKELGRHGHGGSRWWLDWIEVIQA